MHVLIQPFVRICLFRQSPQDLPVSEVLLACSLLAYTSCGILVSLLRLAPGDALLAGLLDASLMVGLTIALLHIQRRRERINQTLTALAGSGALLTLLSLPLLAWLDETKAAGDEPGAWLLIFWLLVLWSFAVMAHIVRHALSVPFFVGLVVAFAYYYISIRVQHSFFNFSV